MKLAVSRCVHEVSVCVFSVPFAFVVLKEDLGDDPPAILQQLRELVATKIAKYAVPDHFLVGLRQTITQLSLYDGGDVTVF